MSAAVIYKYIRNDIYFIQDYHEPQYTLGNIFYYIFQIFLIIHSIFFHNIIDFVQYFIYYNYIYYLHVCNNSIKCVVFLFLQLFV